MASEYFTEGGGWRKRRKKGLLEHAVPLLFRVRELERRCEFLERANDRRKEEHDLLMNKFKKVGVHMIMRLDRIDKKLELPPLPLQGKAAGASIADPNQKVGDMPETPEV